MRNNLQHVRSYASKPTSPVFNRPPSFRRLPTPELSRLPPVASNAPRYVSLRRTEPASAGHLVFRAPAPNGVLDRNHPLLLKGVAGAYRRCPKFTTELFNAKIVPHALLAHAEPEKLPPFSPDNQSETSRPAPFPNLRYRSKQDNSNVIYASFLIVGAKATIHNKAVIRRKTIKRIREALRIIVIRGANSSEDGTHLVFVNEETGEDAWLMRGWSYILFPNLKAYRAPWPSLVSTLRQTLKQLKSGAEKLSRQWDTTPKAGSSAPTNGAASKPSRLLQSKSPQPLKSTSLPRSLPRGRPPSNAVRRFSSDRQVCGDKNPTPMLNTISRSPQKSNRHLRRRDDRADIVLGMRTSLYPVSSYFFPPHERCEGIPDEDFLPLAISGRAGSFGTSVVQSVPGQLDDVQRQDSGSEVEPAHWDSVDAEGWSLAPVTKPLYHRSDIAKKNEEQEAEDDLFIDSLLDSSNLPRFLVPHLPYHAGRGINLKLRREWSPKNINASSHRQLTDSTTYSDFVSQKLHQAADARRKSRKRLRARWNDIDMAWLEELKQREIKRLERMYDIHIEEEKGDLKARASERPLEMPWWAPKRHSLGWVDGPTGMGKYYMPRSANNTPNWDDEAQLLASDEEDETK